MILNMYLPSYSAISLLSIQGKEKRYLLKLLYLNDYKSFSINDEELKANKTVAFCPSTREYNKI